MGLREIFLLRLLGEERILLGPGGQEHAKHLARIQRFPLPRHMKLTPVALMLFHSEGCHHDAMAHWCLWQCDGGRQSDVNKHADQSRLHLRTLSLGYSRGH